MAKHKPKVISGSILVIVLFVTVFFLSACDVGITEYGTLTDENGKEISLTYKVDFYDNFGSCWMSAEGKTFSIRPNKIETYSWNSQGSWISGYEMSSVMSIEIDGYKIESCGSTAIFADSRLEKCDIDFNLEINTEELTDQDKSSSASQSTDIRMDDWLKIQHWWMHQKKSDNGSQGARLVIIQSQLGNSICAYQGNDVSWNIPKNLPKTTMINIDEKVLYIHRANFSIIDKELLEKNE